MDQARFAAHEFVARFAREMGTELSAVISDRMLFAYEMGYLRGRSDGALSASKRFEEMSQAREACKEGEEDDGNAE